MSKRALITGITGQDGAYLAQHLLDQGMEVWGARRRNASGGTWRLDELGITDRVKFVSFELLEFGNILSALQQVKPDEIYNLAAQSFVQLSFQQPLYTGDVDALGVTRLLEAIRLACPEAAFYQASTSEMFGKVQETPQSETTPFYPRSPYGVAKLYAHWMTVNYREAYGLRGCSGILFNHESPLRGLEFVTRKITSGFARMKNGGGPLSLGNLDSCRDWGFAGDYVRGMWAMLQAGVPRDYVLSTGRTHTVREFVTWAAQAAGYEPVWEGTGLHEVSRDRNTGQLLTQVSPEFYRPAEVDLLVGDASLAGRELGWTAEVSVMVLVTMMVEADLRRLQQGHNLA